MNLRTYVPAHGLAQERFMHGSRSLSKSRARVQCMDLFLGCTCFWVVHAFGHRFASKLEVLNLGGEQRPMSASG